MSSIDAASAAWMDACSADDAVRARAFSLAAHGEQRYGDQPYSVHIDAVAALSALPGAEIVLTAGWTGPLVFVRWGISAAIVIVPFLILGRRLSAGYAPRTYRYAA